MARNGQAEVESLKREVDYLRSEHVKRGHDRQEMKEKEDSLAKRLKRAEKAERLGVTLKRGHNELQVQLRVANDIVERSALKIGHLKREVKILSEGFSEAKTLIADLELALTTDPNAKLRFKIKRLCRR